MVSIDHQPVQTIAPSAEHEVPSGIMPRLTANKLLAIAGVSLGLGANTPAVAATEHVIPAPSGGPAGQVGMSDNFTETHWAYAADNKPVRSWPSRHSKARFPLHILAPNGDSEVYNVESTWKAPGGRQWVRIGIPARAGHPKPTEGWVERSALHEFGVSHNAIRINRKLFRLTVYHDGQPVLHTRVGVGRPSMPTPAGHFWVRGRYNTPKGNFQLDGRTVPYSVFGPKMITLSAGGGAKDWPGGGIIAMHGTNEPQLIPGRPSHGPIRMLNSVVKRVVRLAPPGTPVNII